MCVRHVVVIYLNEGIYTTVKHFPPPGKGMILFFLRIPPLLKSSEGNPRGGGGGGGKYTALRKSAIFDRRLSRKRYEICP